MQRIFNFEEWTTLTEDKKLTCGDEVSQARTITLHVNAEDKVKLFVREQGVEHFLALVEGRDEIEFAVDGICEVFVVGGYCNIRTAEQAQWAMEPVDDTTFTTLVQRRIRNPELELMMYQAQRNIESRMAAQAAENERRIAALIAGGNLGTASGTAPVVAAVAASADIADGGAPSGAAETADGTIAPSVAPAGATAPAGG